MFKKQFLFKSLALFSITFCFFLLAVSCNKKEQNSLSLNKTILASEEKKAGSSLEQEASLLEEKSTEPAEPIAKSLDAEPEEPIDLANKDTKKEDKETLAAQAAKAEIERLATIRVNPPIIKGPASGVYSTGFSVTISSDIKEARIVYTIDGSVPDPKNSKQYNSAINLTASTLINAVAFIPGANVSDVTQAEYAIGEICVASGGKGDGRRSQPMGDLKAALEKAKSTGISKVKLSANSEFKNSIDVTFPLLLSGGWSKDFSVQGNNYSTIIGNDSDSSSKKEPAYALKVSGAKADASLKLERLDLRGGSASYSAGLLISDGASPLVVNCLAGGGESSYGYGAAVIGNAAPVFRHCTFSGGKGASSYGLSVDSAKASVSWSFLLAGSGMVSGNGLTGTDANIRLSSSVAAGNSANVSYGAALYNCKNTKLESSSIIGGSGRDAAGVFISISNPVIENCIISSNGSQKSFGIIANYGNSSPERLANIVFLGSSSGLYYNADTKTAYSHIDTSGAIVGKDGTSLSKTISQACAIASFKLEASDNYRTPANTAMPPAKVLSGDAGTDIMGKLRTEPWTIGAYQ